jgi:hypothetical protein
MYATPQDKLDGGGYQVTCRSLRSRAACDQSCTCAAQQASTCDWHSIPMLQSAHLKFSSQPFLVPFGYIDP